VLATRYPPINRLIAAAGPQMVQFARSALQSCHLAVYERGDVRIVAQENSPGDWGLTLRLGARISLLDTGSGRTLLAFQTDARRAEMMAEHRAVSIDKDADSTLDDSLTRIRRHGHWRGPSRQARGVVDISVPILGPSDAAIAVLTCPYVIHLDDTIANGEGDLSAAAAGSGIAACQIECLRCEGRMSSLMPVVGRIGGEAIIRRHSWCDGGLWLRDQHALM